MVTINGKNGISATIIADSISERGIRMTTLELTHHRYILAEANTHKALNRNVSSSRAIPLQSIIDHLKDNCAVPIVWGTNNPGMQSKRVLDEGLIPQAEGVWKSAMESMIDHASKLGDKDGLNIHKQIVNRLLECFTMSKVVFGGTDFNNMLNLRDHEDAQPEFQELAKCIRIAREQSVPRVLKSGDWHLPYIDTIDGKYFINGEQLELGVAQKLSISSCAQVSYRRLNQSIDAATKIFDMLGLDDPNCKQKHSSPTEHVATPIGLNNVPFDPLTWEPGITHVRKDGMLCSGNLRGWIQYRHLIPNESVQG